MVFRSMTLGFSVIKTSETGDCLSKAHSDDCSDCWSILSCWRIWSLDISPTVTLTIASMSLNKLWLSLPFYRIYNIAQIVLYSYKTASSRPCWVLAKLVFKLLWTWISLEYFSRGNIQYQNVTAEIVLFGWTTLDVLCSQAWFASICFAIRSYC